MNQTTVNQLTAKAASFLALGTLFLFPLVFAPITPNFFDTPKLALLVVVTAALLILWAIRTIVNKSLQLEITPFLAPLAAFGIIHFASAFISTPRNVVDPLMNRGGYFLSLFLFVVATTNLIDNRQFIKGIYALIGSGTLLSIVSIFQSFGFGVSNLMNQYFGTNLSNTLLFSPAGSPIALITFLLPIVTLSLFLAFTKTDMAEKTSLFVLSAIMTAGLVLTSVSSLPGKDNALVILPFRAGHNIAIETLKAPKTAFFGVGTNSFVVAYNQFRPSFLNGTDQWNLRFSNSSNEIFQLLTTVGVIGLAAFCFLAATIIKLAKSGTSTGAQSRALKVVAVGTLIFFILIPANNLLYFTLIAILSLWSVSHKFNAHTKQFELSADQEAATPQTLKLVGIYAPALLSIIAAVTALFMGGKVFAAEMTFKKALDAAVKNEGIKAYDLERKAILQNPYLPRYRRTYAATNLALANALASNKELLTDQDKKNITQLIQQAIREAKIAASLEPENALNWESMASIYRSLINSAQGADQWTVAAISQAIQADPYNPALRVDLGGVYYTLGRYDQAIRLFQQAAELKPDFANAFYNLSHSYQQKKDVVAAYDYMKQTLALTKTDSADYTKAKQELEELSKLLPKQDQTKAVTDAKNTAPAKTNINTPQAPAQPTTNIELPNDAGPENTTTTQPSNPNGDIQP